MVDDVDVDPPVLVGVEGDEPEALDVVPWNINDLRVFPVQLGQPALLPRRVAAPAPWSQAASAYAQVARDRALALGRDDALATVRNQLANCLVDESRFDEAAEEYRRALALQPEGRSAPRALLARVSGRRPAGRRTARHPRGPAT